MDILNKSNHGGVPVSYERCAPEQRAPACSGPAAARAVAVGASLRVARDKEFINVTALVITTLESARTESPWQSFSLFYL